MNIKNIITNKFLWILFLPIFALSVISFYISLRYDALYKILSMQVKLENKVKILTLDIRNVLSQPKSKERQQALNSLFAKLENKEKALSHYKSNYSRIPAPVYRSFFIITILSILFYIIAILPNINIPLYVRFGAISIGFIWTIIHLIQWMFVLLYSAIWYQKVGAVLLILCSIVLSIVFIRKFITSLK